MNICRWIYSWADRTPDKPAVRFKSGSLTYSELADDVNRTACALQALGVKKGQRVAWLGYNSPHFLSALFACARIGAILVPLNFRLAPREHLFMLRNADAKVLVFDSRFAKTAELIAAKRKSCKLVSIDNDESGTAQASLEQLKSDSDGVVSQDLVHPRNPVLIIYTSGTTGRPKGAVLTQRTLHWNGLNSQFMHDLRRDDHILTTLPFFHVGGLNIQTTPALQVGATVTLIEKFQPGEFLSIVERDRPTLTVLVPTQMQAVASHRRWHETDLSSLRCVTTGSTMVQMPLLNIWHDHEIPVIQIYGCTESGPIAIHQVIESAHTTAGTVGRPAMYCDVRVVDNDGKDVADGEPGELLLKGPNILKEYWRDPEATDAALHDGWLQTGDIGRRDEDGNFLVVDRKKRMIISGGENIYPSEIERILAENPAIIESVVVGVADEQWGEIPVAAYVSSQDLDAGEIAATFEGRIGHLKHPRHYVRIDALPKNAMGKIVFADVQAAVAEKLAN